MLVQNAEVRFSNYGINANTFECDYVLFGLEFVGGGPVVEFMNLALQEDFSNVRQTIELKVMLDLDETVSMQAWLATRNKTLTIDGVDYQVVSDFRDMKWPLFKNVMGIGTNPVLKFKAKTVGIITPEFIIGSKLEGVIE